MSSSTGSLDRSSVPQPNTFSFSTANFRTSFSDLLNGIGSGEDGRSGGVPKFKSRTPPSLPINNSQTREQQQQQPLQFSPSCFFAIPPGLSPAELLDSPVLLAPSSHVLSSPTTGAFPTQQRNSWVSSNNLMENDERSLPEFSFHATPPAEEFLDQKKPTTTTTTNNNNNNININNNIDSSNNSINNSNNQLTICQNQMIPAREARRSDDGYNWRKYGQKQVKGSLNPRSYYKCTFQNCPTKKKVERSVNGQITEIVYKGNHNHPKPQSTRRNSSNNYSSQIPQSETSDHYSSGGHSHDAIGTPDNSSVSVGDEIGSQIRATASDCLEDEEPEAKRWRKEKEKEGTSASVVAGNKTVKEPRVVVQTRSDIDILVDGYRWRKYGQKVVKGNPNPRSYYKCTAVGCPVRKHVERAPHDQGAVITTYEGKHDHDVPIGRGDSGSVSRSSMDHHHTSSIASTITTNNDSNTIMGMGPYDFSGYSNQITTKDEPRDDLFIESLLY